MLLLGLLGCQLKKTMASPIAYLESVTPKEATSWLSNTPISGTAQGVSPSCQLLRLV
jgi:hypothetical protein